MKQIQQLSEQIRVLREENSQLKQQQQQHAWQPAYGSPPVSQAVHVAQYDQPGPPPGERGPLLCYNCNQPGHFRANCPLRRYEPRTRRSNNQYPHADEPARVSGARLTDHLGKRAYLNLVLNGRRCACLLDTGCELTVLPARLVDRTKLEPTSQKISAANGSDIPVLGHTSVVAEVGDLKLPIEALISEHVFEPMLGLDWMCANDVLWVFKKGVIKVHGRTLKLVARPQGQTWVRRVMVAETIDVPPRAELDVRTGVMYRDSWAFREPVDMQWATARKEIRPGLHVSGTVIPNESVVAYVRVANLRDEPVQLDKGTVLTELEPVQVLTGSEPGPAATPAHIAEMLERVDPSIPESTALALEALLNKYASAFSAGETDLGYTDAIKHTIDTGNNPPARQALRKVPIAQRSIIDKHIDEQLQQGVITPGQSAFAANLVIVKKRDGSTRCCVDYKVS